MKMVLTAILAILSVPGTAAFAQDSGRDQFQTIRFHRVHLRNGNVIDGNLVSMTDDMVTLKLISGEMSIKRGSIEKIEYIKMRSLLERPPVIIPKNHKDAEKKPSDAPPSAVDAPKKEAMQPLPTPGGVSAGLRDKADAIVEEWMRGKSSDRQLARQFEDLGPDVIPYLSLLLEQRTKVVPVAAICNALTRMGDERAIPGLSVAVKNGEQSEDRRQAVLALIKIGTPDTEKAILSSLEDPASTVWKEAKDYLVERYRKGGFDELPNVLSKLMSSAQDKQPYATTLGSLGNPEARRELIYLLGSSDDASKRAALQGLSVRPVLEDGAEVARYLHVRDQMLKREACLFLGKVKYAAAVPDLILMLEDQDSGASANAYWALKEITGEKLAADKKLWEAWFDASTLKKDLQK